MCWCHPGKTGISLPKNTRSPQGLSVPVAFRLFASVFSHLCKMDSRADSCHCLRRRNLPLSADHNPSIIRYTNRNLLAGRGSVHKCARYRLIYLVKQMSEDKTLLLPTPWQTNKVSLISLDWHDFSYYYWFWYFSVEHAPPPLAVPISPRFKHSS